jgi:hypothetical protein
MKQVGVWPVPSELTNQQQFRESRTITRHDILRKFRRLPCPCVSWSISQNSLRGGVLSISWEIRLLITVFLINRVSLYVLLAGWFALKQCSHRILDGIGLRIVYTQISLNIASVHLCFIIHYCVCQCKILKNSSCEVPYDLLQSDASRPACNSVFICLRLFNDAIISSDYESNDKDD